LQAKAEVEAKLALKKQQLEAQGVDLEAMTQQLSDARKSMKDDIERTSSRENSKLRERLQHRREMARRKREQADAAAKAALVNKQNEEAKTRAAAAHIVIANKIAEGGCSFMYRYISRESCSQFDSLPLTSVTISPRRIRPPQREATARRRRSASSRALPR
jgi:hypothetical protein